MSEYTLTLADNGYVLEYDNPQPTRLVYEGGTELPLRLMSELLGDITEAVGKGDSEKFKVTINIEVEGDE